MDERLACVLDDLTWQDGLACASWQGLHLHSEFQPIYSLSHRRAVGHEALLRARDAQGRAIPPLHVLRMPAGDAQRRELDRLLQVLHVTNFARQARPDHWLFLNVPPWTLGGRPADEAPSFTHELLAHAGMPARLLVQEILEDALQDEADFEAAVAQVRASGCLIALDDFGAGHSNFDRVWRVAPEIVKLDRGVVARAAREPRVRRVMSQMIALLRECGALVLVEGIESEEEAFVALEGDADFVQGYRFGRPAPALAADAAPSELLALWSGFGERWQEEQRLHRQWITPYLHAIGQASVLLAAGRPMHEACREFLALPQAELCYLLGADGLQRGENLWSPNRVSDLSQRFAPLQDGRHASWVRRPYFRRAIEAFGRAQVTRPYLTLHGAHLCVTVSISLRLAGELLVVCGDIGADGPR